MFVYRIWEPSWNLIRTSSPFSDSSKISHNWRIENSGTVFERVCTDSHEVQEISKNTSLITTHMRTIFRHKLSQLPRFKIGKNHFEMKNMTRDSQISQQKEEVPRCYFFPPVHYIEREMVRVATLYRREGVWNTRSWPPTLTSTPENRFLSIEML